MGLHVAVDATEVGLLRDELVGAVLGGFEVETGGPVVAKVLGVGAGRAGGLDRRIHAIRVHRCIERVPAHDLMGVRRWNDTGVYQRVGSLNDQLRAGESQQPPHVDILTEGILGRQRCHSDKFGQLHDGSKKQGKMKNALGPPNESGLLPTLKLPGPDKMQPLHLPSCLTTKDSQSAEAPK